MFLGQALATPHERADPSDHLLASWVITRPFTELVAWPLGGKAPAGLDGLDRCRTRRGPGPDGPVLGADECRHVVTHLQSVADRPIRSGTSLGRWLR